MHFLCHFSSFRDLIRQYAPNLVHVSAITRLFLTFQNGHAMC